jgi:hypothetical protein
MDDASLQGSFFQGNVQNGGFYPAYTTVAKENNMKHTFTAINTSLLLIFKSFDLVQYSWT